MSQKKSYMDRNNILAEGFFSKLFNAFKIDTKTQKKIKSNTKVKKQLIKLNKSVSDLENSISKLYGMDVELSKYKLSDFE